MKRTFCDRHHDVEAMEGLFPVRLDGIPMAGRPTMRGSVLVKVQKGNTGYSRAQDLCGACIIECLDQVRGRITKRMEAR